MSSTSQLSTYTAYLLRCWLDGAMWRYSIEEIGVGQRQGFATLDELVAFLLSRTSTSEVLNRSLAETDLLDL